MPGGRPSEKPDNLPELVSEWKETLNNVSFKDVPESAKKRFAPTNKSDFKSENALRDDIIENIEQVRKFMGWPEIVKIDKEVTVTPFGIVRVPRKKSLGRVDIFITHPEDKYTIIEVKNSSKVRNVYSGIGQLLYYKLAHTTALEIPQENVKMALASSSYNNDLMLLSTFYGLNIDFLAYKEGAMFRGKRIEEEQ